MNGPGGRERLTGQLSSIWKDTKWWTFCHTAIAASVAKWFSNHPQVEYISRDRAGVYGDEARQGTPQARQGADRFHLLMNFR